jgi:hypothetical protein
MGFNHPLKGITAGLKGGWGVKPRLKGGIALTPAISPRERASRSARVFVAEILGEPWEMGGAR